MRPTIFLYICENIPFLNETSGTEVLSLLTPVYGNDQMTADKGVGSENVENTDNHALKTAETAGEGGSC